MATVNQVYQICNTAQNMAYGSVAVNVINTATLVQLGDHVLSSSANKDAFVNTLFDRIGLTLVDTRLYNAKDSNIIKRDIDFGIASQKIHVDPVPAEENPEWLIGGENFTPEYAPVIKPTVKQKIFNDMVTYECGVTVPDNLLKTAFVNEVKFGAMIVAIMSALENGIELVKERCVDLTRATMIAYCLKNGYSINMLAEYNNSLDTGDTPLTAKKYLKTPDALADGMMLMALTSDRMERMNVVFNADEYKRFTPKDFLKVDMLNVFDYAVKYQLKPIVYNEEFLKLPGYNLVPYWMGAGKDANSKHYQFDDISRVCISTTNSSNQTETVADQKGVIAVLYDEEACGVNIFGENSAFDRNDHAHYTTHYRQMTAQYFVDESEQCAVFYIADPATSSGSRHEKTTTDEKTLKENVKKITKAVKGE